AGCVVTAAGTSMGIVDTLDNTDMIFVSVIEQYLPAILGGVMLAGLMAAIMSSADAMLLAISAGIAHDIYKEHINPKASERFVTGLGLVVMIAASIVGIMIAIDPPGLIAIMVGWVGGFLLSSFGFPIVLGIWWKRANMLGALTGMLGGALVFLILIIGGWLPTNAETIIGEPVSLILRIIVSLITESPSKETQAMVDHYHTHLE